jgi:lipoprotein-anchoring transpeptidase ErfK/SrfK
VTAAAPRRAAAPARLTLTGVNAAPRLPVRGGAGPGVLHVQTLLTAVGFSPGVIDGRWREGTRQAVRVFRQAHGLERGDAIDEATYARLRDVALGREPVVEHTLTPADVRGPFRQIPASPQARAKLDCLCYTSLSERLAERFHTSPEVLRQLNPDVRLDGLTAGRTLRVPNVARIAPRELPARLIVDKATGTLRGLDALGAPLFVFPASVGSASTPSPVGRLRVLSVTRDPWYHHNAGVLARGQASGRTIHIPPGPNSPVGTVWIQLSKAHVGIHGTPEPEHIGSTQSHGCVRLTNWDAAYLAGVVGPGTEVEFKAATARR